MFGKRKEVKLQKYWFIKKRKKEYVVMSNTIKLQDKKNTQLVAHRGVSGLETENTSASFISAGNRSYYGIETDIHKTKDGRFVCIHDVDTKRVSNEVIDVTKATYEEIKAVKLKDFYSDVEGREDLVIPLLEDYISICKKYLKHAVLELKDEFADEDLRAIVDIVEGLGYLQSTTFISFVPSNLTGLRAILPNQSIMALTDTMNDKIKQFLIDNRLDLDVYFRFVDEELVKELKEHGIKINVWTVDDVDLANKLIEWGVDYITTNILE